MDVFFLVFLRALHVLIAVSNKVTNTSSWFTYCTFLSQAMDAKVDGLDVSGLSVSLLL